MATVSREDTHCRSRETHPKSPGGLESTQNRHLDLLRPSHEQRQRQPSGKSFSQRDSRPDPSPRGKSKERMALLVKGGVRVSSSPVHANKIQYVRSSHQYVPHLLSKDKNSLPLGLCSAMWFWAGPHTSPVSATSSL